MPDILSVLPKWITSSVRKQFQERVENLPVFLEEEIKTNNQKQDYVELRIDGPFCCPFGAKDEWEAIIEVNGLVNAGFNEKDSLRLAKLGGTILSALSRSFCVFRYGTEPYDDDTYVETLQLITDDNVEMSNFGQIDSTNKIYQATVEAHYKMRFKNGTV